MAVASVESVFCRPLKTSVVLTVLVGVWAFFLMCAGCTCSSKSALKTPPDAHDAHDAQKGRVRLVDVSGIVVDSQGEPLPDVMVLGWLSENRGKAVVHVRTGLDGRFKLLQLMPGRWTLLLEAPGLGTLEVEKVLPDDSPLELAMDGMTRVLTGIVLDQNNQFQGGALVTLGGVGMRWIRETRSDTYGLFSFRGIGFGKFSVRASHADFVSTSESIVFEEGSMREKPIRLTLIRGGHIRGAIVDDQGAPLPRARIELSQGANVDLGISGVADEQGNFQIGPLLPGRYQVTGRTENYVLIDVPDVAVKVGETTSCRIRLSRTACVRGRVLDTNGTPFKNQSVTVISLIGGKDELTVLPGPLPLAAEAASISPQYTTRPGGVCSSEASGDGTFLVNGIAPGKARLQIAPRDHIAYRLEPLLLGPGDCRDVGDIIIQRGSLISGWVEGVDSSGLEGVLVEVRSHSRGQREVIRGTSDARGQFQLRVPAGRYSLAARSKSFKSLASMEILMEEGKDLDSIHLKVDNAPNRASR